ncbi:iron ABC transporter permease [Paenibacillus sp. F411]|uniref:Putative siderophore transport system permease protein YfiZ n=1 Tax=Paenibacillus algicola TaxID=2565926 RepID=A0A4P8XL34_9BACL|nr:MULTISPECIES: iron ABC transporter permease [Paenibacillus]MBO2945423.1 iron ABC transporter permease [Paenibacillus sp. F411]QCT00889.1 putative siderophore transport system permease protein YfiZ [Paenibacillus algicola]
MGVLQSRNARLWGLLGGLVLLLAVMLMSILLGLQNFNFSMLLDTYQAFNGSTEHMIIRDTRVPRTLIGAMVGAGLAASGAVMQAITRNPLASPSIFGINSGAVLCIVIAIAVLGGGLTMSGMIWIAFAGAALTALLVFVLGFSGPGGFAPVKLTLAGSAIAAFSASITSGIILIDKQSLDQAMFWMIGSVVNRSIEHVTAMLPYFAAGMVVALLLARALNVAMLGDDVSKGLGISLLLVRAGACVSVVLLAGSGVAVAGPIAFVGIVVPHLCRSLVGHDHRWLIPYCAIGGGILLVSGDLVSRFIIMPKEVPVGVAMALIGVPFLIYIVRRKSYVL